MGGDRSLRVERDCGRESVCCRAGKASPVRSRLGGSWDEFVRVRRSVVGAFEEVHTKRVTGSLAMFDRMIFTLSYRRGGSGPWVFPVRIA